MDISFEKKNTLTINLSQNLNGQSLMEFEGWGGGRFGVYEGLC